MKTKFKALTYCNQFIDANRLDKGLYTAEKPFIYSEEETIESIIKTAESVKEVMGSYMIPGSWFENLKKCTLVKIELKLC